MFLEQLYYFKRLSEVGQITRAAQQLHVTQPTLSRDIKKLEEELGIKLVRRSGRSIELTDEGKVFATYVGDALAALNGGLAYAREKAGTLEGTVSIGGIITLRSSLIPQVMEAFMRRCPGIEIRDRQGITADLMESLAQGDLEAVFCACGYGDDKTVSVPLIAQQLVALVPRSHRLSQRGTVRLADLYPCEITTYDPASYIGTLVDGFLHSQEGEFEEPLSRISMDEMTLAHQVRSGNRVGVTLLTSNLMPFPDLVAVPFEEEVTRRFWRIGLHYRADRLMDPALRTFVDFVRGWEVPDDAELHIAYATPISEVLPTRKTSL